MRRRRPVLDVGLNPSFLDSNPSSYVAPVFQSSNFSKEDDVSLNTVPSVSDLQGVPYQHVSEVDPSQTVLGGKPYTPWQVCADETTGYTYYWNVETNQVTWEIPAEYLAYEAALQQYQLVQAAQSSSEIHPLIRHKIARTTQEVIANRNLITKKLINEGKSVSTDNNRAVSEPYGPAWEDDGSEDAEARKIVNAKKRLLSYKSDKLKQKLDESTFTETSATTSSVDSVPSISYSSKTDAGACNIPFVPTPDEIKEHPIFSSFSSSSNLNDDDANATQVSKPFITRQLDPPKPCLVAEQYCSDEESDNEDEHSDDVIITRLRKKALMLKELGGDVPKEIISVLDDSKTAKDIIAEIEKEIPPDTNDANDDDSIMEMDLDTDEESENFESSNNTTFKSAFSNSNQDKNSECRESRPPQRSLPITRKTQMKNIQKIKLSARARELIKTSLLTAKARATNFIETDEGLKPAEEVLEQKKEMERMKNAETLTNRTESIQECIELPEERRKREEMKRFESEIASLNFIAPKEEEFPSDTIAPPTNSVYNNFISGGVEFDPKASNLASQLTNGERSVFPVKSDDNSMKDSSKLSKTEKKLVKSELVDDKNKDDLFAFQSSFVIPNAKRTKFTADDAEAKKVSLVSKCEEFLQSVKKTVESDSKKKITVKEEEKKKIADDIDIDVVLNTKSEDEDKSVIDFSQLIMEKLKFLNDGKSSVTPVQVMAIQIETLIGAWQTKALTTSYLQDWLNISSVHLKDIEEAAAPKGWQCEWDRSYGRYYYRNKKTGAIQWDFPECDDIPQPRRKHRSDPKSPRKRPRTPPPPTISDTMVPPPPPIISDHDSRKQKSVINADRIPVTERSTRSSKSVVPPLPTPPCAPPVPPPPPPSSPPPLPPPPPSPPPSELPFAPPSPPVISETLIPSVIPVESKLEPIVSGKKNVTGLYDELSSFYSDIATIEATISQTTDKSDIPSVSTYSSVPEQPSVETTVVASKLEEKGTKKKKKVKLDSTLSLKKKGLEGLVAKWQKVNSDI